MNLIKLLRKLIAKETDEAELKNLNEQLIEAIQAEEADKATKAAELKYGKKIEELEKKTGLSKINIEDLDDDGADSGKEIKSAHGMVKITEAGAYKGYNLKAAVGSLQNGGFGAQPMNERIMARAKAFPAGAEIVSKWMIDQLTKARTLTPDMIGKAQMVEGTDGLGGYTTPTEERAEVLAYIREVSIALPNVTTVPMMSDVQTHSREEFKPTVAYTAEASDATESSATFAEITLTAKRMDAYTKVSNELLQDTTVPGGIAGLLAAQFFEAVGQKVDSTVFMGTGDPVSGVFLSAGTSVVFDSGSTNFSELLESNLRTAIRNIKSRRLGGAKWYAHRIPTWDLVYGLQDSNGRPYFVESNVAAAPHQAWGYPWLLPEEAPYTSAVSTGFIVFGDLSGFLVGERLTNVQLFIDPYSLSRSFSTQFLMFTRWAYAHALPEYYTRIATPAS